MDIVENILNDLGSELKSQYYTIFRRGASSICYNIDIFKKVKKDKRYDINVYIPGNTNIDNIDDISQLSISNHPVSLIFSLKQISKSHKNAKIVLHSNNGMTFIWTYKFLYKNGKDGYIGIDKINNEEINIKERVLIYPSEVHDIIKQGRENSDIRYIVFPVSLYSPINDEENIKTNSNTELCIYIYDKELSVLTRFTPMNKSNRKSYEIKSLDSSIKNEFKRDLDIKRFDTIYDYIKHADDKTNNVFNQLSTKFEHWDASYYWSIWFFDLVCTNPSVDMTIIIAEMLLFLSKLIDKDYLEKFISKYSYKLLAKLLNNHNIMGENPETQQNILDLTLLIEKIPENQLKYINKSVDLKNLLDQTYDHIIVKDHVEINNVHKDSIVDDELIIDGDIVVDDSLTEDNENTKSNTDLFGGMKKKKSVKRIKRISKKYFSKHK